MNPFSFSQPEDAQAAIGQVADNPSFAGDAVRFIAGTGVWFFSATRRSAPACAAMASASAP